jgi:hypothetical protein
MRNFARYRDFGSDCRAILLWIKFQVGVKRQIINLQLGRHSNACMWELWSFVAHVKKPPQSSRTAQFAIRSAGKAGWPFCMSASLMACFCIASRPYKPYRLQPELEMKRKGVADVRGLGWSYGIRRDDRKGLIAGLSALLNAYESAAPRSGRRSFIVAIRSRWS